ncbi:MAG: glycosyltransferase family 4 protein [Lachnospiraceae bacterium]|nr:glycosyltransferase family 4 protein [Lachnospiraceae bacterium]
MLGHKRIPSREGGVEIVVEELATRMVAMGHQVVAYNRKGNHVSDKSYTLQERREYKGVNIVNVFTLEKKGLNALIYSFFATIKAVFGKHDVIHYHAEGSCAMIWIPKLFGIRTVATIHGLDWKRAKWGGFATRYLLFGEKMAAKYADEVVVLSKNMQKYFMDTYKRETKYIPNGISLPTIKSPKLIKEKYNLEKEEYILFLARIVPEKGVHYLIEAFKQINTEKKLVIAGGSSHTLEYYKEIKAMAETDSRIILTGFVQDLLLEELYSNCCLYVLPSDVEGMPISLLEAMGYGRRCLVSDIPENTELVAGRATVFKHGDIEDLKNKLVKCLEDKEETGKENISYVKENFNWNKIAEQTLSLYKK